MRRAKTAPLRKALAEVSGEIGNYDNRRLSGFLNVPVGDVFAVPDGWPGANVFSVGDALMLLGALLVLHAATGSRLVAARRTERPRAQGSRSARPPKAPRAT